MQNKCIRDFLTGHGWACVPRVLSSLVRRIRAEPAKESLSALGPCLFSLQCKRHTSEEPPLIWEKDEPQNPKQSPLTVNTKAGARSSDTQVQHKSLDGQRLTGAKQCAILEGKGHRRICRSSVHWGPMESLMAGLVLGILLFRNRSQPRLTVIHTYCWGFEVGLSWELILGPISRQK